MDYFPRYPDIKQNKKHKSKKVRSKISMVWVPPLGFDPYCEGKWLPLQDEFTPSINAKKLQILQILYTNLKK